MTTTAKQNTPHFTSEVIAGILAHTKGYKQMLCALLGGTGLRAGEAIGLEIDKHIAKVEQAETVGLGFVLPAEVVRVVRKKEAQPEVENAA